MTNIPNCYKCKFRRNVPGDAHSQCINKYAKVKGHETGIRGGWFFHPFNFDPRWLINCDGFEEQDKN